MNDELLKYHVNLNGHNLCDLAEIIGVNPATLTRKMKGESDFKRNEMSLIKDFLKLTNEEIEEIFFV